MVKIHKSSTVLNLLEHNFPKYNNIELTKFPQCMPDKYKNDSVVQAYRNYYKFEKSHLNNWKSRDIPFFMN